MNLSQLESTPPWDWPVDAGKELSAIFLDSRRPVEERQWAASLAGSLIAIDDQVADALLTLVVSGREPDSVRGHAAIALGPVLESGDNEGFDDPEDMPISESTFHRIQDTLRIVYRDPEVPMEVRRRVLEASVRAPCDWHKDAVRVAYYSDDPAWQLTAVFAMRFVASFEEQILEAIENPDQEIRCEAILAAGVWEVEAAWPYVRSLLHAAPATPRSLLIAAIGAAGDIGGEEGLEMLQQYSTCADEELADAADEALLFSEAAIDWNEHGWEDEPENA